jgi:hypothetical protein
MSALSYCAVGHSDAILASSVSKFGGEMRGRVLMHVSRLAVIVTCALMTACGSSDAATSDPLDGTWAGLTTAVMSGGPTIVYNGVLVIRVTAGIAKVSSVCPDGSNSIDAIVSGNTLSWTGDRPCPAVQTPQCGQTLMRYHSAVGALSSPNTLTVTAGGYAICGSQYRDTIVTFTGAK